MSRRSLRLVLGSGAAVLTAAVTMGSVAHGALADAPAHTATRTWSHWFEQVEPAKDKIVVLRNGSTPSAAGRYKITVRVGSRHHRLSCFVERRGGEDLGPLRTVAADNTETVVLATDVPRGTQYNLICIGTSAGGKILAGGITESSR
jgi:hypothetical protein